MPHHVGGFGEVPDGQVARETLMGGDVGVGLVKGRDQQVAPVRRRIKLFVPVRLADGRDHTAIGVDQGDLRGAVVIEQILVVAVVQSVAVFVGAALATGARGFLDARTEGNIGFGRGRALMSGHQLDQQRLLVGHPLEFILQHRVQPGARDAMYEPGGGIAHPELDGIGSDVLEREAFAVGAPHGRAGATAFRKAHVGHGTVGHVHQVQAAGAGGDAVTARGVVLAVVLRLDAHASQPEEWRRHSGDGRVVLPGHKQDPVPGGARIRHRRRWSPHDVQNVLGRLVITRDFCHRGGCRCLCEPEGWHQADHQRGSSEAGQGERREQDLPPVEHVA